MFLSALLFIVVGVCKGYVPLSGHSFRHCSSLNSVNHLQQISDTLKRLTGSTLPNKFNFEGDEINDKIKTLIDESEEVCLLAHDGGIDPVFNYCNLAACTTFGYNNGELIGVPSRMSAEEMDRDERDTLLKRVRENGYVDDYEGMRIRGDGGKFWISKAVVWNVESEGEYVGQAALFHVEDIRPV